MKTKKTPYWTDVIARAKERKKLGMKPFTRAQMEKSECWVTCACGKQDERIVRGLNGCPEDIELTDLGMDFCDNVTMGDPHGAAETLAKIEKRSAELLELYA